MGKPLQLELFKSQEYQYDKTRRNKYKPDFFVFIKAHEKAISIIIICFIISLVSFSMGVEKGKRLTSQAQLKTTDNIPQAERLLNDKPEQKHDADAEKTISTKYTIQVATFKTSVYAEKEAERLKKEGLDALVIPSGKYVIVCVGNFSERQEAKVILSQLRKTYHDCFVRRL